LELVRNSRLAAVSALVILLPVVALGVLLRLLERAAGSPRAGISAPAAWLRGFLGLGNPIVTDALFAFVLVYTAFMAGSYAGFRTFEAHMLATPRNPLPSVAVVLGPDATPETAALACSPRADAPLLVIGDAAKVTTLRKFNRLCTANSGRTWRLLYRDESSLYVFATETGSTTGSLRRPLTAILPNTDQIIVIME
jgi:hypothetical protein